MNILEQHNTILDESIERLTAEKLLLTNKLQAVEADLQQHIGAKNLCETMLTYEAQGIISTIKDSVNGETKSATSPVDPSSAVDASK